MTITSTSDDLSRNELESVLLSALERAGKPVSAAQLNKLLPKPFQRKSVELAQELDRLVKGRRAFELAGKTPKYSRTDPREVAERALLGALERGNLKAQALKGQVKKAAIGLADQGYAAILEELVSAGRVYQHFKVDKAGRPTKTLEAYSLQPPPPPPPPPRDLAEGAILSTLAGGRLKPAELKAEVTAVAAGLADKDYTAVLNSLVRTGRVHAHFKIGKDGLPTKTQEGWSLEPPPPPDARAFVSKALEALEDAFANARRFGVAAESVVAALVEASGVDLASTLRSGAGGASSSAAGVADVSASSEADEDAVLAGLKLLVSRERAGALIPIRHLRRSLSLSPLRFDSLVLGLERAGKVILHHHDFPGNLSESERAELVVDRYGTHYVGIALGRS